MPSGVSFSVAWLLTFTFGQTNIHIRPSKFNTLVSIDTIPNQITKTDSSINAIVHHGLKNSLESSGVRMNIRTNTVKHAENLEKNKQLDTNHLFTLDSSPYFSIFAYRMDVIEDKTKVSIAYVLKEKGRILEEVPASHPFVYIHGYNNIIPGLENALIGKKLGEKFSIAIPASLGYGEYRKDLIFTVPKEELRDVGELWIGMELEMFQEDDIREFQLPDSADEFVNDLNLDDDEGDEADGIYIIKEIYKDSVVVDGNHPFAGKDLVFDVEIVNIEAPSFTELESGFPDKDEDEDYGNSDYNDNFDNRFGDDYGNNENRRWR